MFLETLKHFKRIFRAELVQQDIDLVLPRPWGEPKHYALLVMEDVVRILYPGPEDPTGYVFTTDAEGNPVEWHRPRPAGAAGHHAHGLAPGDPETVPSSSSVKTSQNKRKNVTGSAAGGAGESVPRTCKTCGASRAKGSGHPTVCPLAPRKPPSNESQRPQAACASTGSKGKHARSVKRKRSEGPTDAGSEEEELYEGSDSGEMMVA